MTPRPIGIRLVILFILLSAVPCLWCGCAGGGSSSRDVPSSPAIQESSAKATTITSCRLWKCPSCGEVLEKGALGKVVHPGEPASRIVGTATCGKCGAKYSQSDVYGGRYDYDPAAKEQSGGQQAPTQVSLVVFALGSTQAPTEENAKVYCEQILSTRHPDARMVKHLVVGFMDQEMTAGESVALYESLVKDGKLPDLGRHFDSFVGPGPDGKPIAVLFFSAEGGTATDR